MSFHNSPFPTLNDSIRDYGFFFFLSPSLSVGSLPGLAHTDITPVTETCQHQTGKQTRMHKGCAHAILEARNSASAERGEIISVPSEQDGATLGRGSNVYKGSVTLRCGLQGRAAGE